MGVCTIRSSITGITQLKDHLGRSTSRKGGAFIAQWRKNIRAVVNTNGTVEQINNYFAFGGLLNDASRGTDVQKHKYNGKELDRMHGLDWYDYGARNYDAVIGQFTTMDPMCEKYYHISPYVYCMNNPVKFIDVNGLYPKGILVFNKVSLPNYDYYNFTKPTAKLLSLVSGVDYESIKKVRIMERGVGKLIPWYSSNNGGGAITLGDDKKHSTIYVTNNYFEDDSKVFNGNGYGQNEFEWLDLMSHEVTHLNDIEQAGSLSNYMLSFAIDYIENGHNGSEREKKADESRKEFRRFNKFVNSNYEKNALSNLFNSDKNDTEKIRILLYWWNDYQSQRDN